MKRRHSLEDAYKSDCMAILGAALDCAAAGIPVFPCQWDWERPCTDEPPSTDAGTIRRWWSKWREALIGRETGRGLAVISHFNGLRSLEKELGPLPATYRVRTPGDWEHRYFRVPSGVPIRSCQLAEFADVRGEGEWIIAPHNPRGGKPAVTGHRVFTCVDPRPMAPLPPAWLERLRIDEPSEVDLEAWWVSCPG